MKIMTISYNSAITAVVSLAAAIAVGSLSSSRTSRLLIHKQSGLVMEVTEILAPIENVVYQRFFLGG